PRSRAGSSSCPTSRHPPPLRSGGARPAFGPAFASLRLRMASPVTGERKGATTAVRCVDVAALVASAVPRKNPPARVMPFDTAVHDAALRADARVLDNATRLARYGGGGTNCSLPLAQLNAEGAKADLVIYVSDNESWVDVQAGRGTATM